MEPGLKEKIRSAFDVKTGKWYYSVVDVVGILTETSDARNYWKVLKNRLKKSYPELVTKCNQLKMESRDGKFYLTDVADALTMLEIVKLIPSAKTTEITAFLCPPEESKQDEEIEFGAELLVDLYQKDGRLVLEAMVAGVPLEDLSISVFAKAVVIKGEVDKPKIFESEVDYIKGELYWGNFYRKVPLPYEVFTDKVEIKKECGHLIITLERNTEK